MAWYDTLLLSQCLVIGVGHTAAHHVVLFIVLEDLLESVIVDSAEEIAWSTNEISDSLVLETTGDSIVASMKLGPHLLKKDHPKFRSVRSGKGDLVALAWNEVVDDDLHLDTILEHGCSVDAILVGIVVQEHGSNSLRSLCNGSKRGQEVAITNFSLFDIVWLDIALEDMQLAILINKSWNLSDSAPLNGSQIHEIINLVVWIDDTLISSWEIWISEHLAGAVVLVQN